MVMTFIVGQSIFMGMFDTKLIETMSTSLERQIKYFYLKALDLFLMHLEPLGVNLLTHSNVLSNLDSAVVNTVSINHGGDVRMTKD